MSKKEILLKIEKILNEKIFLVGGAVRDLLLGRKPNDIDIVSSVVPEDAISRLEKHFKVVPTGIDHGTITIIDIESGFSVEHTTFRKDIKTNGRKAIVKFTDDIVEDLKRRDFTINSMALSLDGKLIDPFGGRKDIANKIIRTTGNPEERFKEDYLRILRGCRFSVKYGFDIDENTKIAMKRLSHKVEDNIPPERIRSEFLKSNNAFFAGWMSVLRIWKDISKNWFYIKKPENLLVELAIHSDEKDLDKYRFTKKEKKLTSLFKHAVNGNWKAIYSARNQPDLISSLKKLLKKYSDIDIKKVDEAVSIKPESKDSLVNALNNL